MNVLIMVQFLNEVSQFEQSKKEQLLKVYSCSKCDSS